MQSKNLNDFGGIGKILMIVTNECENQDSEDISELIMIHDTWHYQAFLIGSSSYTTPS